VSIKVEVINGDFHIYPETYSEKYACECALSLQEGESTDPESIRRAITLHDDKILQEDDV
jgi:hypothetical protein